MDDKTALAFNTICNFIRDLNASFGNKQKSLLLYGHLIEKTGLIHIEPVKKHIAIFKEFVEENQEAIEQRKKTLFKKGGLLSYSEKVAIDLSSIFDMCDKEEEKVVWNHLLTISAVLNPVGNAKQILKDLAEKPKGKEDNFLKNIMDKIGSQVEGMEGAGENANPMQMIGSMMSSGVFNDIFQSLSSGLNEGDLDLGSMMNSMQSIMSNLNTMVEEVKQEKKENEEPSASTPTSTTDK